MLGVQRTPQAHCQACKYIITSAHHAGFTASLSPSEGVYTEPTLVTVLLQDADIKAAAQGSLLCSFGGTVVETSLRLQPQAAQAFTCIAPLVPHPRVVQVGF